MNTQEMRDRIELSAERTKKAYSTYNNMLNILYKTNIKLIEEYVVLRKRLSTIAGVHDADAT